MDPEDSPEQVHTKLYKKMSILKNIPGIIFEERHWKTDIYYDGKYIGFFEIGSQPKTAVLLNDLATYNTHICICNSMIKDQSARMIKSVLKKINDGGISSDIKDELNELRKVVPSRFQEDDTAKFLRRLTTYIECLQFNVRE